MMRGISGDGNCFYRAVMYAYLEFLLLNEDQQSYAKLEQCIRELFTGKKVFKDFQKN